LDSTASAAAGLSEAVDVAGGVDSVAGWVDSGVELESDWLVGDGFVGVSIILMPKIQIYRTERQ
jgi:hypothetical protein